MAQIASPYPYFTVEEYFEFEEQASVRHEYIDGQLYAMVGASARHNQIIWNLITALTEPARAARCTIAFQELKLQVTHNIYYYPDLMVVCDPTDNHPLYRANPCLVVEVLSPGTAGHDQREKLFAYRQIEALQTYLMTWQDKPRVQRHFRADGGWANGEFSGTGSMPLPCPEMTLTLDAIYRDVDFSTSE
jgi:Uma2 family endonuclease